MEIDTELMAALAEEGMDTSAQERINALPDYSGEFTISIDLASLYCLPKNTLDAQVRKYITYIEDSPTAVVCKCTWLIHPDDEDLPPVKQRKKRSIEHPRCMVHTKLGFLVGFFAFTFPEGETDAADE